MNGPKKKATGSGLEHLNRPSSKQAAATQPDYEPTKSSALALGKRSRREPKNRPTMRHRRRRPPVWEVVPVHPEQLPLFDDAPTPSTTSSPFKRYCLPPEKAER